MSIPETLPGCVSAYEPEFRSLISQDAELRRLWTGGSWTEGPTWLPMVQALVFSDVPNDRQLLYSCLSDQTHLLRGGAGHYANGTTLDQFGGLLVCEHGTRSLARLASDGRRRVLASHHAGKRLNSPNDVAIGAGAIWFTDPSYGIEIPGQGFAAEREQEGNFVYRLENGQLAAALTDFAYPNGIAIAPDGALFVADSGGRRSPGNERHIRRFDMKDGRPTGGEVFATCPNGVFDGFRIDNAGRVWASASNGVYVIAASGTFLGHIAVPECVANLCFGGPQADVLFITATTSLYAIQASQSLISWG